MTVGVLLTLAYGLLPNALSMAVALLIELTILVTLRVIVLPDNLR